MAGSGHGLVIPLFHPQPYVINGIDRGAGERDRHALFQAPRQHLHIMIGVLRVTHRH